jgi:hypothetical protein
LSYSSQHCFYPTKFTILGPCFFFDFPWPSFESGGTTFESVDLSFGMLYMFSVIKSSSSSSPLTNLVTRPVGLTSLPMAESQR